MLAIRSVAMLPGAALFSRMPSRASSRESVLNAPTAASRWLFESISPGIGSLRRDRGDVHDAAPAALAASRDDRLDQRHRRQHEAAVRLLPLLARERERVTQRRPARVRHEDVDRAERLAHGAHERGSASRSSVSAAKPCTSRRSRAISAAAACDALGRTAADRDARTLRGERRRDRAAEAFARAHHQRDLPVDAEVQDPGAAACVKSWTS